MSFWSQFGNRFFDYLSQNEKKTLLASTVKQQKGAELVPVVVVTVVVRRRVRLLAFNFA